MKLSLSEVNAASPSDEEGGAGRAKLYGENLYTNDDSESVKYGNAYDKSDSSVYDSRVTPAVELGEVRDSVLPAKPPARNQGGYFAKIPLPLSMITIFTASWLVLGSILDIFLAGPVFADVIINFYFVFFGISILSITCPTDFDCANCLKGHQSTIEKWARFLATNWGRAYFMLFICILSFSRDSWFRITIGLLLIINGVFSLWCGRLAGEKYNRLREYLVAGNEGDDLKRSVKSFKKQMLLKDGKLTERGLKSLIEYSGRFVTNSEVHAIFCFFDRDRTGKVGLDSFIERIADTPYLKSL